nr:ankyrin repeat-containing protein [Cedratvirus lena]WIL04540.1 ankyrin repeat-containing protein [Cedratvirus duvanny]
MQTNEYNPYVSMKSVASFISEIDLNHVPTTTQIIESMKTSIDKILDLSHRGYLFNDRAVALLAAKGELDLLKFCVEELDCPVREEAFSRAAEGGHIECMRFTENYKHDPMDALYKAIAAGQLEAVKYIMAPCTRVPDMERIRFYQQKGGFPKIKTYLVSILGDF